MKTCFSFFITLLILAACNNTSVQQPEIDTHSSSNISQSKQQVQIDAAKENRTLLPGKWDILSAKLEEYPDLNLSEEINARGVIFFAADSFKSYHKKETVDKGTYEWMADDRELVLTSSQNDSVSRMLVKSINTQYMKVKFNGMYVTFKKG